MSLEDIRTGLATVLAGIDAEVYKYRPETVVGPAIVVTPGEPWLMPDYTMGPTLVNYVWRFDLWCMVAALDARSAEELLDALTTDTISAVVADSTLDGAADLAHVVKVAEPDIATVADGDYLYSVVELQVQTLGV